MGETMQRPHGRRINIIAETSHLLMYVDRILPMDVRDECKGINVCGIRRIEKISSCSRGQERLRWAAIVMR